jgi:hypothetical protein
MFQLSVFRSVDMSVNLTHCGANGFYYLSDLILIDDQRGRQDNEIT